MNRGEGFKAMNTKDIVLPKRDLDYKVKLVSNDDWLKKVWIFLVLSARENPHKTQLTSPPFSDPLCSLFSGALLISFLSCSSLDICLFTYAFSCSLSRFSRRILPISASFLTSLRVSLDWLYAFYFLLSLVALSLSFQPTFTQNLISTNLNYNSFPRLTKIKYNVGRSTLKYVYVTE